MSPQKKVPVLMQKEISQYTSKDPGSIGPDRREASIRKSRGAAEVNISPHQVSLTGKFISGAKTLGSAVVGLSPSKRRALAPSRQDIMKTPTPESRRTYPGSESLRALRDNYDASPNPSQWAGTTPSTQSEPVTDLLYGNEPMNESDNASTETYGVMPEACTEQERLDQVRIDLKEACRFLRAMALCEGTSGASEDEETIDYATEIAETILGKRSKLETERHAVLLDAMNEVAKRIIGVEVAARAESTRMDKKIDEIMGKTAESNRRIGLVVDRIDAAAKSKVPTRQGFENAPTTGGRPDKENHTPNGAAATNSYAAKAARMPTNPNRAHHPSRFIVQFPPGGIAKEARLHEEEVVRRVNEALGENPTSAHLHIVAATYNQQGNLILSTRSDQTAAEVVPFTKQFIERIAQGHKTEAREDKRWFKIQVDGVSTRSTAITIDGPQIVVRSPLEIHEHLARCNPAYADAIPNIVALPRWMRSQEETRNIPRSSIVFAVDNEAAAKKILELRSLAAFSRHCTLRAYQDRPPIRQCKKCWGWDHAAERCKEKGELCRLCGEGHTEEEHKAKDRKEGEAREARIRNGEMATEEELRENWKCTNCATMGADAKAWNHPADSRRCPARIAKYGTSRNYEKIAERTADPWKVVIPKQKTTQARPGGKKAAAATKHSDPTSTDPVLRFENAFATLDPDLPHSQNVGWNGQMVNRTAADYGDEDVAPSTC
jgi:hypothetical protein